MIFGISCPEVESDILEERIAILKAVKCPGKTHSQIKSKELRDSFARELNDYRNQRLRGRKQNGSWFSQDDEAGIRWGLESGFWAMQKDQNRAFLYDGGRRVAWRLVEAKEPPTAEYQQYEAAVIAEHKKLRDALAKLEADFQAGKIDKLQRSRARLKMRDKEEARIRALQKEYSV